MSGTQLWVRKPGTRTRSSQGTSWFSIASRHVGGGRQEMVVKSGRDLIVTEFSPFYVVRSFTHTVPASEKVELGFLIKLHSSFPSLGYWSLKMAFFFLKTCLSFMFALPACI